VALADDEVGDVINGIFQLNARLGDIAEDVREIRRLLMEEDDGGGDQDCE
jgi:hypothetical protein